MKQKLYFRLMFRRTNIGWITIGVFPSKHLARQGVESWKKHIPTGHFMIQKVIEVSSNIEHIQY